MQFNLIRNFIKLESASSIILFAAALLALIIANSPWQNYYESLLTTPLLIQLDGFQFRPSLETFIDDGLMTIFFLFVSLEIKRELIVGELNSRGKALLPGIGAIGGILIPAIIFLVINFQKHSNLEGWAIPTATDIAFSLGILSLLGKRIPSSLKVFLTALAIIDDLGAIIIIAMFYTKDIAVDFLLLAALCVCLLVILNLLDINRFWPYGVLGFILWLCILKSGVHATIAGVFLGLIIPLHNRNRSKESLLQRLEHKLHPYVAYGILPLFAFTNAGLAFEGMQWSILLNPLVLGIAAGLFFGKPIGIVAISGLSIKLKIARLPNSATWRQFCGVAIICGMGFTMSLFIGTLAFPGLENPKTNLVMLGVLLGSLLSGLVGYLVLRTTKVKL